MLMAKASEEKQQLEDLQKQNALLAEKAGHDIKEKATKLAYDEEVFALTKQIAAIEEQYRDTVASAQEQVAAIQTAAEEARLNERHTHLEALEELRQSVQELKEKGFLDAQNRQQSLELMLQEMDIFMMPI